VRFAGAELDALPPTAWRSVRGREIAMIFQEPMTSMNPVQSAGAQVIEAIRLHQRVSRAEARQRAVELFERVRIPDPAARLDSYPHQLSGGMKQRVMLAMALACRPKLLIADEPTTALDVTIQAEILELLRELSRELGMALLLITHDLGVVNELADRVAVMYAGRIVETGPVRRIFAEPAHPYTRALLESIPRLGTRLERLSAIEGQPPDLARLPAGCAFAPRCPKVMDRCRAEAPPETGVADGHSSRCWLHTAA